MRLFYVSPALRYCEDRTGTQTHLRALAKSRLCSRVLSPECPADSAGLLWRLSCVSDRQIRPHRARKVSSLHTDHRQRECPHRGLAKHRHGTLSPVVLAICIPGAPDVGDTNWEDGFADLRSGCPENISSIRRRRLRHFGVKQEAMKRPQHQRFPKKLRHLRLDKLGSQQIEAAGRCCARPKMKTDSARKRLDQLAGL